MENNLDQVAKDIYGKIQTRFPAIKIGDENAMVLSKKSDIPKARFFEFQYEEHGVPMGIITITLDEDDGIVIEVSGELSDDTSSKFHDAYSFIRSFKKFAKNRLLNYKVKNIGKNNLDKRDYEFRAKPKEISMMESKMFGTSRISYQDLGEARVVVKHNQNINPEIAGARSMHIDSIFIENTAGERFKYPYKHLNGARALAEHIKHGGTPYDSIGKHITGLSEELTQLRKFKNYVGRQTQISEAMGSVTDKVLERIEDVKKQINQLQRTSYYENFAESFEETLNEMIPEEIMNDWVDRLTVRSFNEELKSVFPYLYNIVETKDLPVCELNADDLLDETFDISVNKNHIETKIDESFDPYFMLESFFNDMLNENKDELFSPYPGARNKAINNFNELLSQEMTGGTAGVLALKGIMDDPAITNKVQVLSTDPEIRAEIKQYILEKNPGLLSLLPKLNIQNPKEIGGQDIPNTPVEPAPAPAPIQTPEVPPTPEMGAVPPTPEMGAVPPQPVAESVDKKIKLKARFIKAKTAGATLETQFAEGMTLLDAIKESGLSPEECGFVSVSPVKQSRSSGVDEILQTISGFWNKEEKNFTIGGTRAKIKVVKAFEDGECPNATPEDVKRVLMMISQKDPSPAEPDTDDMVTTHDYSKDTRENHMFDKMILMKEQPLNEGYLTQLKRNAGLL